MASNLPAIEKKLDEIIGHWRMPVSLTDCQKYFWKSSVAHYTWFLYGLDTSPKIYNAEDDGDTTPTPPHFLFRLTLKNAPIFFAYSLVVDEWQRECEFV